MFDTMTGVKVVAGLCGALLVFLLVNWAGNAIYFGSEHGHEGAEEHAAFMPGLMEAEGGAEEEGAAGAVDFAALVAEADPAKGEKTFSKCKACHKLDGTNATGPHLDGVVGRPVASVEGFNYSQALRDLGGEWTPERLNAFLENPKGYAKGTKMGFAGLKKVEDRAAIVKFLETVGG
ncbi:MAG: cytochrome c family protein [Alphaproteobacteria bacterium]|nr:MAG: cytochrome c family protein [Alphaproteobacteria bacterium]